jgi:hypothetical protein
MADIEELRKEVTKHIEANREKFNSIRWGNRHIEDVLNRKKKVEEKEEVPLHLKIRTKSKQEVYDELKHKFRFAWKGIFLIPKKLIPSSWICK